MTFNPRTSLPALVLTIAIVCVLTITVWRKVAVLQSHFPV